jgi:hypothetical protein
MEDDLEYWEWIRDQRTEDLSLEMERGEDDELIRILKGNLEEANIKVEELSNE